MGNLLCFLLPFLCAESTDPAAPTPTGSPPIPTGSPPTPTGSPPTPTGSPPTPTGSPPTPTGSPPTSSFCGNGNPGDGVCADPSKCCSQFGYCGTGPEYCDSGPTGSPPGTISSDAVVLTTANVLAGVNVKGDSVSFVSQDIVDEINAVTQDYTLYRQLAFVAHTIWESGSYQFREEQDTSNRNAYQDCDWSTPGTQFPDNGKLFYGRGYMQLSWCANYKAYGSNRRFDNDPDLFYNQPELVATNDFYAMDSAAWFFEANVRDESGQFGITTKAINGALECPSSGGPNPRAVKRYQIFVAIANSVGLTGYSESGCYN